MRKMTRAVALALAGTLVLSACGDAPEDDETTDPVEAEDDAGDDGDDGEDGDDAADADDGTAAEDVDFKACMITDQGGVDDGSFNETAYNGLVRAEEELGIETQVLESDGETDFEPNMQTFITQGDCDLIVPVGFLLAEVTFAAAEANPEQDFAIVDVFNENETENVLGLNFNTDEAAFLAGYAAAATTESGTLGTYGGINIPPVTIFMNGFLAGMNHYNEEEGGDVELIGWDGTDGQFTENFTNLDDGRRITESLLDNGADTILPVAGPVGGGSAAAIQDRGEGRLIWVDTDGYESTDFGDIMFTSIMKQMDVAVFDAIELKLNDQFEGGNYFGTLENDGVALAPFHDFDGEVDQEVKDALDEIQQGIIAGEIEVAPSA